MDWTASMIGFVARILDHFRRGKKTATNDTEKMLYFGVSAAFWKEFDLVQKVIYLKGLFDGAMCNENQLFNRALFADVSIEKYIEALDVFYQDEKNAKVPIPFAIYLASKLLSGAGNIEMYRHLRKVRQVMSRL